MASGRRKPIKLDSATTKRFKKREEKINKMYKEGIEKYKKQSK